MFANLLYRLAKGGYIVYDLRVVVHEVKGFCDMPMKVGDYFEVKGGRIIIPEGKYMCLWALQSMMPFLPLKQRKSNEKNDWVPYTDKICCPDPNGMVIYKIEVVEPSTKQVIEYTKKNDESVKSRILVYKDKCTGCRACETICSFIHSGSFCGVNSRIRIEKREQDGEDIPYVCRQCGNAPCVQSCPVEALYKDPETKAVLVDQEKCTGCKVCSKVCPFSAISFGKDDGKVHICNLCGGDPACVKRCPVGAIRFGNAGKIKD